MNAGAGGIKVIVLNIPESAYAESRLMGSTDPRLSARWSITEIIGHPSQRHMFFCCKVWLPVRHGKKSRQFEFHGHHSVESGACFPSQQDVPEVFIPTPLGISVAFSTVLQHSGADRGIVPRTGAS